MDRNVKSYSAILYRLCVLFLAFYTITSVTVTLSQVYAADQTDTEPPTSSATLLGNWNGHYYTSSVEVSILASDQSQGIKYTAYRINSGTWIRYTEPFFVHSEGIYTISYFSEDNTGNPEQVKTTQFEINSDTPSPTPELTQSVFVTSAPTPTSEPTATPTKLPLASPTVTPTKTPTPIFQFFPASLSYYRSPTKAPTPTPTTIKTTTTHNSSIPIIFSPTPTAQLLKEAVSTNHHDEPQNILGQWTKVENDRPESSNSFFVLILAIVILLAYISFVYYYYSKINK